MTINGSLTCNSIINYGPMTINGTLYNLTTNDTTISGSLNCYNLTTNSMLTRGNIDTILLNVNTTSGIKVMNNITLPVSYTMSTSGQIGYTMSMTSNISAEKTVGSLLNVFQVSGHIGIWLLTCVICFKITFSGASSSYITLKAAFGTTLVTNDSLNGDNYKSYYRNISTVDAQCDTVYEFFTFNNIFSYTEITDSTISIGYTCGDTLNTITVTYCPAYSNAFMTRIG
jgi:hypothetical protein